MLYSTFYLNEALMALPIPCILEIGRSFKVHPVRGAPEIIDGLVNLRGKVVTILNSGLAFGGDKVTDDDDSRILILKNNSELREVSDYDDLELETSPDNIGLHVDRIADVINVESEQLCPVPTNMQHPFYKSVVRRENEFIIILEPRKLLSQSEHQELLP